MWPAGFSEMSAEPHCIYLSFSVACLKTECLLFRTSFLQTDESYLLLYLLQCLIICVYVNSVIDLFSCTLNRRLLCSSIESRLISTKSTEDKQFKTADQEWWKLLFPQHKTILHGHASLLMLQKKRFVNICSQWKKKTQICVWHIHSWDVTCQTKTPNCRRWRSVLQISRK